MGAAETRLHQELDDARARTDRPYTASEAPCTDRKRAIERRIEEIDQRGRRHMQAASQLRALSKALPEEPDGNALNGLDLAVTLLSEHAHAGTSLPLLGMSPPAPSSPR